MFYDKLEKKLVKIFKDNDFVGAMIRKDFNQLRINII